MLHVVSAAGMKILFRELRTPFIVLVELSNLTALSAHGGLELMHSQTHAHVPDKLSYS